MKRVLIILFIILAAAVGFYSIVKITHSPAPTKTVAQAGKPGWITYHDLYNHISLEHPEHSTVLETKRQIDESGYGAGCDSERAKVCIVFPEAVFSKTNFNSAAVSINFLPELSNENGCLAPRGNERNGTKKTLNGVEFTVYKSEERALSLQSTGADYRTFGNGRCIEITSRINTKTYEEYPTGSISHFSESMQLELQNELDDIIATISFQ